MRIMVLLLGLHLRREPLLYTKEHLTLAVRREVALTTLLLHRDSDC